MGDLNLIPCTDPVPPSFGGYASGGIIPRAKIRGFEVCKGWEDRGVQLPEQATKGSAGYDFYVAEDTVVPETTDVNLKPTLVPTGVKAYMRAGEFLSLHARSSLCKRGIILANQTGIVDSDFAGNPSDDGHIRFMLWNVSDEEIILKRGERIGQGIFMTYLQADQPRSTAERVGGFGSSGQ